MRLIPATLTALLSLGMPLFATEEKPLPKELPPFGQDRPLPRLEVQVHQLPNGLTIWLVPRSGLPKVSLTLGIRGGTASDPEALRGTASLMARLLKEGTRTRTSRQIAEQAQALGGTISSRAGDDQIIVNAQSLSMHAPAMVELLADVALNPSFPQKELELTKTNTLQNLKAQEGQPEFQAQKAFNKAIFGAHPYAFTHPDPAMVQALTVDQVRQAYTARSRPDQAILAVAGDFDGKAMLDTIRKSFGAWKGTGQPLPAVPAAPRNALRRILLVDRPGSVQSQILVGRPGPEARSPERHALELANSMLGGGFDSRLMKNIREDKGYTYSPGSQTQFYLAGGSIQAEAAVRNEVTAAAVMEIQYEMDRLGSTPTLGEELESHKRLQAGIYLLRNQILGAVTNGLVTAWLEGEGPDALSEFVTRLQKVKPEETRDLARRFLASKDQTVVVVGDAAKVKSDLEQFGPVEVVKP